MSIAGKFSTLEYGPAPEDPKDALEWLDGHQRRFEHFIDGRWTAPGERAFFETIDPASGENIAEVAQGSAVDIDRAVKAARSALPKWRGLGSHARARYLYAMARAVQRHSRRLAVLETIDNGKPIRESRDIDIPLVARHFYYHAGWAQLLDREFPEYEPCGVVGQIIPWNFPLLMLAWKIAPALATGNTVVLKPAEFTPITALAFADICREIELPPGVVNIVTGDGSTGEALVQHADVDKIAFTGSTEVGRAIRRATAAQSKRLSLELGGKSPFVVFEDADLDSAVEGLVDGIWLNQGQVCCAGSRLLMQESIAEVLILKIQERMGALRVGSPLDKAIDIGAIVAPVQLQRIRHLVECGIAEGATCWQPEIQMPVKGLYFPPTLLSNVQPSSIVAQQEIFGPVLASMTFRTPSEAVELANNTAYGLAASVWSESVNLALQVAAQVKAGVVWVNSTNLFDAACGFGGYRESGFGREGGREGLLEYLQPKWIRHGHSRQSASRSQKPTEKLAPKAGSKLPPVDRTVKLYIGGKQARPDSGYSFEVRSPDGVLLGEAPSGNRKDIRNAVQAARNGTAWSKATAHLRSQVLYYVAENLALREQEIAQHLAYVKGTQEARKEVEAAIQRTFSYAAWADKFDGAVHSPPMRSISIAMNEPVGTVGIVCPDEYPLLGLLSLLLPVLACGNTAVAVTSENYPLIIGDLYQVFDTSDVPAGAVNLISGQRAQLLKTLAEHDDVDAIWCFADQESATAAKLYSVGNLKQVFTNDGHKINWLDLEQGEGRWYLEHATQVKNIWVPYGE